MLLRKATERNVVVVVVAVVVVAASSRRESRDANDDVVALIFRFRLMDGPVLLKPRAQ